MRARWLEPLPAGLVIVDLLNGICLVYWLFSREILAKQALNILVEAIAAFLLSDSVFWLGSCGSSSRVFDYELLID